MADSVDHSALTGKTGLVKEHTVTSDSETTIMRSVNEIKALDQYLTGKNSCNATGRTKIMRSLFGFRGVPRNFQD